MALETSSRCNKSYSNLNTIVNKHAEILTIMLHGKPLKSATSWLKSEMVSEDKVYVCGGLLCCITGIYTETPDCVGCIKEAGCVCLDLKLQAFKDINTKGPQYVTLNKSELVCQKPQTCLKSRTQCCCFYNVCAVPCDKELAPSVVGAMCVTCYPKFGVMQKLSEIPKASMVGGGPPPPETDSGMSEAPATETIKRRQVPV